MVPPPAAASAPPPVVLPWWRRQIQLLVVAGSLAALLLIWGLWGLLSSPSAPPAVAAPEVNATPQPTAEAAAAVALPPERRWLPNQTRFWLGLRPARLQGQEGFARAIEGVQPLWQASVARLLDGLGLKPQAVARLRWASPQWDHWTDACVVVLELEKNQDLQSLQALGAPIALKLQGHQARQAPQGPWPLPFAVLGPETVVTGSADLLAALAEASKVHLENESLGQLVDACALEADAALVLDLAAARKDAGRLPAALLEVWPAGRAAWPALSGKPQAMAVALQSGERQRWELGLACESEAAAQQVQAALEPLVPAAKTALEAQGPWLTAQRGTDRFPAEAANAYEQLLQQAGQQVEAARRELVGSTVWVRGDSPQPLAEWATTAWTCRDLIAASWLDAAQAADKEVLHHVLEALEACRKAEGSWPAGAGDKSLLPPETQLSWIANLLPYLGHADWHKELKSGYSWNSSQNRSVTSRPVAEVVNPALGPSSTRDGFPVTHYAGVAGVGPDAGKLKASDPRAGVFGFARRMRPADIADGAGEHDRRDGRPNSGSALGAPAATRPCAP